MIPQLLLEEILNGEKNEKDFYTKYGKEELQAALAELRKSNEEILSAYPAEAMKGEIIKKVMMQKNELAASSKKSPYHVKLSLLRYSAAAALALAFLIPLTLRSYKSMSGLSASPVSEENIRLKGENHHQIRLYRQNGSEAVLLKNGSLARENDLIQITYLPGTYSYGVIFSVDGNKNITRHFPENSWKAEKLQKTGGEVPLSFSYSLDDAPDYECFIFVASKKAFDLNGIEKLSKENIDIEFLKKGSYLPKDADGSIFVLKKE